MPTRYPARDADDDILTMLRLRCAGRSTRDIAVAFGTTQKNVSFHTAKIKNADLAESGEPVGAVRSGYWA